MSQNPFKREQNQERHLINKLAVRVRNLERRFIDAGGGGQVYYYSDIVTVPAASVVIGVEDCVFGLNTLTSPDIFDPATLPTVTPTVLETGTYAFTFHSQYRQGQADHPGSYAQPSIDMADGGDPLSVADDYELRNLLSGSYRGRATITGEWIVTAGDTIQANIGQTYSGGTLNYNYDLFVLRLK